MEPQCLAQKRIWEVDCLSMDAALAASFDWRDLLNILHGMGIALSAKGPEWKVEMQVHNKIHQYCHGENSVSLCIEGLLNALHQKTLRQWSGILVEEIAELALSFDLRKPKLGAVFWAVATDSRPGLDCIRRQFHQRYQIASIRTILK